MSDEVIVPIILELIFHKFSLEDFAVFIGELALTMHLVVFEATHVRSGIKYSCFTNLFASFEVWLGESKHPDASAVPGQLSIDELSFFDRVFLYLSTDAVWLSTVIHLANDEVFLIVLNHFTTDR